MTLIDLYAPYFEAPGHHRGSEAALSAPDIEQASDARWNKRSNILPSSASIVLHR
jgi:hypothetical protein